MAKYQSAPAVHVVVKCKEKGHRWLDRYKDEHTYTYRDRYRKGNYIKRAGGEREKGQRGTQFACYRERKCWTEIGEED